MINARLIIRIGSGTDGSSHAIAPNAVHHPVDSIYSIFVHLDSIATGPCEDAKKTSP